MRFTVQRYRTDFAGLEYRVVDQEENEIMDEALDRDDAQDLADAMNRMNRRENWIHILWAEGEA